MFPSSLDFGSGLWFEFSVIRVKVKQNFWIFLYLQDFSLVFCADSHKGIQKNIWIFWLEFKDLRKFTDPQFRFILRFIQDLSIPILSRNVIKLVKIKFFFQF